MVKKYLIQLSSRIDFVSISPVILVLTLQKKYNLIPFLIKTFFQDLLQNLPFFNPATKEEIIVIAQSFAPNKAAGYDNIPMSLIKESIQLISESLAHIINLSIAHGIEPDQMKIARVIPLFKADVVH